jgi:hypothetical protein
MISEAEGQPIREITGEAVKNRVLQFFPGIDLSKSGNYTQGLLQIFVIVDDETSEIVANSYVNGVRVASYDRSPRFTGHPEDESYGLYGVTEYYGAARETDLWFDDYSDGKDVLCNRDDGTGVTRDEVEDPQELLEIAKTFGVEV